MRKTKIICTLGPAVDDEKKLAKMITAGMDCARFNFSHGSHEEQKIRMDRLRKVSRELNIPVAILLDTKGPEIRTRDFEGGKVEIVAGQTFTLTTRDILGDNTITSITYKDLAKDVEIGTKILIDDGLIELKEKICHTAHRTTTSHDAFNRLYTLLIKAGYQEHSKKKKKMPERSFYASKQYGLEHIEISGGGIIDFRTRTNNGGLGEGFDLLVIDDFGLMDLNMDKCLALFEIIETRDSYKPTVIISQLPVLKWWDLFKDNTYADACLSRMTKQALRLECNGRDMRSST